MANGWDVYYVVFLSAFLALGLPIVISFISMSTQIVTKKRRAPHPSLKNADLEKGPFKRVNTRFFLGMNVASILLAMALILIPCAAALQMLATVSSGEGFVRGLVAIVSSGIFLSLGLFYSARKGDLNWLRSFRQPESEEDPK